MNDLPDAKPWRRRNPKKTGSERTTLTPASVAWARARAARAGRRYPNLIDNMAAAQRQRGQSSAERGD